MENHLFLKGGIDAKLKIYILNFKLLIGINLFGDEKMPVISFDIVELEKEQKEILAKEFAESASRVTGLPIEMIYVLFNERKTDNVGVGGVLLSNQEY